MVREALTNSSCKLIYSVAYISTMVAHSCHVVEEVRSMPLRGLRLSEDLKTRLGEVQKLRGYRSVNAFILEAIEEKLQRTDAVESVSESEARIAADFSRIVREVRSVHNTQQAQYALLDALTKYVSTCVVEPPQDLLVSARARGKLRYEKLLREAAKTITGECENLLLESVASAD